MFEKGFSAKWGVQIAGILLQTHSSSAPLVMLAAGEEQMSEKVTGYIDHVIFRNDENGYTVMVLKTADSEEES